MSTRKFNRNVLAVSVAAATCLGSFSAAFAESLRLDEIVVTASPGAKSKMDSSVSVSTVSAERIDNMVARDTTEIFRSIPGVRSESSAGESNTNLSIRGIPVASGGGKFMQLHEDGLPVMQFGDIIVGNADNYITYDSTVERIEAVKGSTAATMASNSPAGVINFVSKTGEEQGGSFTYNAGLDYDQDRIDFEYGLPVGDWAFHFGGFYRQGEGVRETGYDGNDGGQLKISVKRNFENGHIRVYAKVLDDQTTTYLPMPIRANGDDVNGFDALTGSNIPIELLRNQTGDGSTGARYSSIEDGSSVESTVVGGEIEFQLEDELTLRERFRVAKNSGKFFGSFSAGIFDAENFSSVHSSLSSADSLSYVSGPNAGVPLTTAQLANLNGNGLIQDIRSFDNDINSLDNFTNDLSLTKTFEMAEVTVGYYTAKQDVDINWYWQSYLADVSDDTRLLDAYSAGTKLTAGGAWAYGAPAWGFCCYRDTELSADIDAVYAAASFNVSDDLTINASVRYDEGEANGHYAFGENQAIDFNGDGVFSVAEQNAQVITQDAIASSTYKYDWDYVSWAVGFNYLLNDQMAVFANVSEGGRANADRLGDGGFISNGGVIKDSVENTVRQYEGGIKYEGEVYGVFATLFYVETDDVNSEGTNGTTNTARVREYEAQGLELEAIANIGDFSLFASMTYTDAEIVGSNDPSLVGNTPRRQADLVYSANASYALNQDLNFGVGMIGTTDSYAQDANDYKLDGYTYFNAFINYYLTPSLRATLSVNNLTDEVGITEAEENTPVTVNGVDYVRGRSIAGRTTNLSLKYTF